MSSPAIPFDAGFAWKASGELNIPGASPARFRFLGDSGSTTGILDGDAVPEGTRRSFDFSCILFTVVDGRRVFVFVFARELTVGAYSVELGRALACAPILLTDPDAGTDIILVRVPIEETPDRPRESPLLLMLAVRVRTLLRTDPRGPEDSLLALLIESLGGLNDGMGERERGREAFVFVEVQDNAEFVEFIELMVPVIRNAALPGFKKPLELLLTFLEVGGRIEEGLALISDFFAFARGGFCITVVVPVFVGPPLATDSVLAFGAGFETGIADDVDGFPAPLFQTLLTSVRADARNPNRDVAPRFSKFIPLFKNA